MQALRNSAWEIPLPIFLVAGIYRGFVAVSEAAAVSALYVLVVEVFVYKEILPAQLFGFMRDSMVMVGMNLFIASYRFEKDVGEIYSAALPFMIVLLAALLVITYVPSLTLLFRS